LKTKSLFTWQATLLLTLCMLSAGLVSAQESDGFTVREIRVEGLVRISDAAVRAQLETQAGAGYDAGAVARDIRRLMDMGFFDTVDAKVEQAGNEVNLIYTVEEKRLIEQIHIIGNKRIKSRVIRSALTMREGGSFEPEMFENERQAVLDLYQGKGFANTAVDVVAENVGPSRVRLVYTITEGNKARIKKITFVGNDHMKSRRLRKVMKTKQARWFLASRYDEEKFAADLNNVTDAYGELGYLEAKVASTDMEYSSNGKRIDITLYLEEGDQYTLDSLDITRNIVYDDDDLLGAIKVHPGSVHNKVQVGKDVEAIEQGYQDSGYIDAHVTPQITLDRENKTTNVVYHVDEGNLKYLREIRITGNDITKDEVIRRQMLLIPGERYDGAAVSESENRIQNTRFFDKVRITFDETDDELFTDLRVNVEEGKTGMFNFGAGYSTEDKLGVYTEMRLSNFDLFNWPRFSGAGQVLRLRTQIGERRNEYSVSFTEPEFLGYPLSFGVDAFDESYEVRGAARYKEKIRGGQLRLGKSLSPYVFAQSIWRFQETDLSQFSRWAHPEIKKQEGRSTTIANRWQIERNTLDSNFDASRGSVHILAAEIAGFGGDHDFLRFEHDSTWYRALGQKEKWVLSLRARHGIMTTYGSSDFIPLQERFYAGGTTTVRGYRNRDIGPKVREYRWWGDHFAIGGNTRFVYNAEAKYRVTDIFRLYGFADAGGVWEDAGDVDFGDFNYSVGAGIGFNVPMFGPIRVDYGYPLNPKKHQSSSGRLHMSTGFRF
jgi:outer membrane protein insertion porin family